MLGPAAGAAQRPQTKQMSARLAISLLAGTRAYAQGPAPPAPGPLTTASLSAGGVFPSLSAFAESAPKRSECGVGAMMAWNNMLY